MGELDHDLVPGKISGINERQNLSTGKEPQPRGFGTTTNMNEKRYKIHLGDLVQAIKSHNSQRIAEKKEKTGSALLKAPLKCMKTSWVRQKYCQNLKLWLGQNLETSIMTMIWVSFPQFWHATTTIGS